jgi:TatD DNase family protein
VIDAHCHLADATFASDLDDVVRRAKGAGVESALVVLAAGDSDEAAQAARVHSLWPAVRFGIGVHPHSARDCSEDPQRAAEMVRHQYAGTRGACAIGEIGLDYHYDFSPRQTQRAVLAAQIQLALEVERPVIIHTREADADTIDMLRSDGGGRLRGVLHCFTGGPSLAKAGLDLGFYISVAGIITFPRASDLRDTVRAVPLDRLLIETDSPFLAPVPHRGKRNEPAYVARVAEALAELHGTSARAVAESTTANFLALFGS